jgi:hypothetical protein
MRTEAHDGESLGGRPFPGSAGVRVLQVLVGATLITAVVAELGVPKNELLTSCLVVLAMFKVHLVGMHFMELRHAPVGLIGIFHVWVVAVGTLIVVMG